VEGFQKLALFKIAGLKHLQLDDFPDLPPFDISSPVSVALCKELSEVSSEASSDSLSAREYVVEVVEERRKSFQ
jgi:hypothetical protein